MFNTVISTGLFSAQCGPFPIQIFSLLLFPICTDESSHLLILILPLLACVLFSIIYQAFLLLNLMTLWTFILKSVQFSHSVVSDSLWPHGLQNAWLPCLSPTPRVHPNPCPLSRWCHPTISSSVIPFSSFCGERAPPRQRSWGRRLGIRKGGIEPQESPWKFSSIYPQNQSLPTFCFVLSPTPLTLRGAVPHYLSLKKALAYSSS